MHFLTYYFWIAPHLLLVAVISVMFWRRVQRRFPVFLISCVFDLAEFLFLFAIYAILKLPRHVYQVAAVSCTAISIPLRLGVLYELNEQLLAGGPRRSRRLRATFRWTLAALLLIASAAAATQIRAGVENVENVFESVDLIWSLLVCGVVVAMFASVRREHWRDYAAGIAFGFGIYAAVNLGTSAFRAEYGLKGNLAISIVQMAGYHACVLVWLVYLLRPERTRQFSGAGLQSADLESWNEQLQKLVR